MKTIIMNRSCLKKLKINLFRSLNLAGLLVVFAYLATQNAYAAEENLLSFDKTLVVEFFIFIIAIIILNKLLFNPLVALRYRREDLTVGKMDEARELNNDVEKKIEEYQNRLHDAREEAYEKKAEIRKEAQQSAEKIISDARVEADRQLEEYKKELHSHIEEIKQKIKPEINILAKDIATRVLGRGV